MILLLDNYDSFTYNLFQYLEELGAGCTVVRNDAMSVGEISRLKPEAVVISPGPGTPDSAGITLQLIAELSGKIPILGICLGHQSIGQAFGGKVVRAKQLMHGKLSAVYHAGSGIYRGISNPFQATRYHSLVVERRSLPDCLLITSETADGTIMGLRHRSFPVEGLQFHPESIMTDCGKTLLGNFLKTL
jgi:anthranilate synthase/aminodeoxychorismate synthase-like glutamine amidotransferase